MNSSMFCSINCTDWFLLQPADEDMIELALKLRGRFTGRLSHVYEQTYVKRTQEENEFIDEATLVINSSIFQNQVFETFSHKNFYYILIYKIYNLFIIYFRIHFIVIIIYTKQFLFCLFQN